MFDLKSLVSWVKKHLTRWDYLYIFLVLLLYFILRTIRLDRFPIFTDEGIYIHWAKVAWKDANWRFISLTDGKQPLHTWGMIPFLKIYSPNLLLGGRMFSVFAGLSSLIGLSSLTTYLFGKKAGYVSALIYVFTPIFLFYDRMALADSAVNAGFVWVLFGSIVLARTLRLDVALIFGITSGIALLTKSSTQLFLGLSAFAPIVTLQRSVKKNLSRFASYYVLYLLAALIAIVLYNIQRLSPYLHYVAEKNTTFVLTPRELLRNPFGLFPHNIVTVPWYVASEVGLVTTLVGLVGLVSLWIKDRRLGTYLILWLLVPLVTISLIGKVIFPRYLIFFASLLTIGAAYFISQLKTVRLRLIALGLIGISVLYFNYTILFDHAHIPFPEVDRGQYIESFNSGWGVKEIISYVRLKSTEKPVVLIAEGNFGVIGDMLEASIAPGEPITVKGYWPLNEESLTENQPLLKTHHVYIVFSHTMEFNQAWPMRFVAKYDHPGNTSAFSLFELTDSP